MYRSIDYHVQAASACIVAGQRTYSPLKSLAMSCELTDQLPRRRSSAGIRGPDQAGDCSGDQKASGARRSRVSATCPSPLVVSTCCATGVPSAVIPEGMTTASGRGGECDDGPMRPPNCVEVDVASQAGRSGSPRDLCRGAGAVPRGSGHEIGDAPIDVAAVVANCSEIAQARCCRPSGWRTSRSRSSRSCCERTIPRPAPARKESRSRGSRTVAQGEQRRRFAATDAATGTNCGGLACTAPDTETALSCGNTLM